jgi:hypothetical protein
MLVNRDENSPHTIRVELDGAKQKRGATFSGPVTVTSFGSDQYVWVQDGANSHADPDHPPVGTTVTADASTTYTLPKASVTVIRGKIAEVGK